MNIFRKFWPSAGPPAAQINDWEIMRRLCEEALGRPVAKTEGIYATMTEVRLKKGWTLDATDGS